MPKKAPVVNVPDGFAKRLGDAIQQGRAAARISRDGLAACLGVAKSTLVKWEQGVRIPEGHVVAQICRLLGLDANLVLGLATDAEVDQVRKRVIRLVESAGSEKLARQFGVGRSKMKQILQCDFLVLSQNGIELIAKTYDVSSQWLRTGKPEDWTPNLHSLIERLRFYLICHGIQLEYIEGFEIRYSLAAGGLQICSSGEPVRDLGGMLGGLRSTGEGSPDFPFNLAWVMTGSY